ncbi:MAG: PIN domain-containing protein [Acidobacteriota bacterium]|nr:PIN domain-containing protein [Acidobacteriota bacterium]
MILADTGFWLALANPRDRHHATARRRLERLAEPLITTWPVITETCYLLLTRIGPPSQREFLTLLDRGGFEVFPLDPEHVPRTLELMQAYEDLPMDLADASLVVLAEALGHGRILSTGRRDFGAYRWKQREPFENLLLGE